MGVKSDGTKALLAGYVQYITGLQVINMTRSLVNSRSLSILSHCVKDS